MELKENWRWQNKSNKKRIRTKLFRCSNDDENVFSLYFFWTKCIVLLFVLWSDSIFLAKINFKCFASPMFSFSSTSSKHFCQIISSPTLFDGIFIILWILRHCMRKWMFVWMSVSMTPTPICIAYVTKLTSCWATYEFSVINKFGGWPIRAATKSISIICDSFQIIRIVKLTRQSGYIYVQYDEWQHRNWIQAQTFK